MVGQREGGSKKPKLSLQKKEKASKKVLTLPSSDLNETCDFQPPSKIVSLNVKKKTKVRSSNEGKGTQRDRNEKQADTKDTRTQKIPVRGNLLSAVKEETCCDSSSADKLLSVLDDEDGDSNDAVIIIKSETNVTDSAKDENSGKFVDCPACEKQVELVHLQDHIQVCLKFKFERKERQKSAAGEVDTKTSSEDDVYICQICNKNLSHFNSQRRTKHVNQCIDKQEEVEREENSHKMALEAAKRAILDCPMCGKPCKTENSRKSHMKKCAQDLKLPTEQALMLIKKQEEINNLKLAAGIVPVTSKHIHKPKTSSVPNPDRRKMKEPLSKLEEDLQVAMAMSSSLREEEERKQGWVQDEEKIAKKFPGLKSAFDVKETKSQKRKKKVVEPKPLMFVLSEEEKQQRLQDRISNILLPQDLDEDNLESMAGFRDSKLTESSTVPLLWSKSSLEGNVGCQTEKKDVYYVESLMPPIKVSTVMAGSKIKPMSAIPGRRDSTFKYPAADQMTSTCDRTGDTLLASTQTAVVLAELAEEEEEDITNSGFCPEKPISVEHSVQSSVTRNLCSSMLSLINNPDYSDVDIVTATDDHIHAHTAILMARCPMILQLKKNNMIDLHNVSTETVVCVLKFIYGGEICVQYSILPEIIHLTERLELRELFDICYKLKQEKPISEKHLVDCDNQGDGKSSEVEDLMQQIWGLSYSEEDGLDKGVKGQNHDSADDGNQSDISEEDYREIMCSQRMKFSKDKKPLVVVRVDGENNKEKDEINNEVDEDIDEKLTTRDKAGIIKRSMSAEIEEFFLEDSFDLTDYSQKSEENVCKEKSSGDIKKMINVKAINNGEMNYKKLDKNTKEILKVSKKVTLVHEESTDDSKSLKDSQKIDTGELKTRKSSSTKNRELKTHLSSIYQNMHIKEEEGEIVRTEFIEKSPSRLCIDVDNTSTNSKTGASLSKHRIETDKPFVVKTFDLTSETTPCKNPTAVYCSTPTGSSCAASESFCVSPTDFDITPEQISYRSSPLSRKRKHKEITSPRKSPVAVCISSKSKMKEMTRRKQDEGFGQCDDQPINVDESPINNLDHSGVDLFCTPSPAEKHLSDSQNHSMKRKTPHHSSKRLKLSPNRSSGCSTEDDSHDMHSKTLNTESPCTPSKSKLGERNFRMKLTSSSVCSPKKATPSKTPQSKQSQKTVEHGTDLKNYDEFIPEKLCSEGAVMSPLDTDDDIEIIGDNMEELSQASLNSPVFTAKEATKKKWTFKSKKILKTMEIDDPMESDEVSPQKETPNNDDLENNMTHPKDVKVTSSETDDHVSEQSPNYYEIDEDVWGGFDDSGAGFNAGLITCDTPSLSQQANTNLKGTPSNDQVDMEKSYSGNRSKLSPDLDYSMPEGQVEEVDNSYSSNDPDCSITAVTKVNNSPTKSYTCTSNIRSSQSGEHHRLSDLDNSVTKEDTRNQEVTFASNSAEDHGTGDLDDSILWNNDDNMPEQGEICASNKFKTPSETRQKKRHGVWVPPSPFTPMPEYDVMNTPQLKNEVQRFGVKPVGKKRMRLLLKDIYQQTHQYETDSEFEEDEKEEEPQVEDTKESDEDEEEDMELNSSQESTRSDLMEETVMPEETDEVTSTQQVKDGKELKEKLFDFIKSRSDIHTRILMYEPLELDWLKKEITETGIKCSMDKLRDFLDEKCITFTMKAMRQERAARKGRGQKKGSPKKGSPKKRSPKKKSPKKKSPKKKTVTAS